MTTFQEAQRWLRQKKASGRLSPTEEKQAYEAYFQTEAGQLDERARIEQQAERDAEAKRQAQFKESAYLREEEKANEAAEITGRAQALKLASPDLFMDSGKGDNGFQIGGAQTETQNITSGKGTPAIGSGQEAIKTRAVDDLTPSSNQEAQSMQTMTQPDDGLFGGDDFGDVIGGDLAQILGIDKSSNIARNLASGYISGSWQGSLMGMGIRLATKFVQRNVELFQSLTGWGEEELGDETAVAGGTGATPNSGMDFESIWGDSGGGDDGLGSGSASDIDSASGGSGGYNDTTDDGSGYGTGGYDESTDSQWS